MDFFLVTSTILKEFESQQIRYAVIGGFALGFWGVTRATIDIDFLLLLEDESKAEGILFSHGYQLIHKTENVAQYQSRDVAFGSVDIIFAFREISRSMLERSVHIEINPELKIRSLLPEDIIGLKVQALSNDQSRFDRDIADIKALLAARHNAKQVIDWDLLEDYFELFDQTDLLLQLKTNYDSN